jgi:cytochrome c-type biogenesis protein CcmH/NrfF
MLQNSYMILDWANWTFWVTPLALIAFGFSLRVIYEQWHSRKIRRQVHDDAREIRDLTRRLQTATERLNNANADARS